MLRNVIRRAGVVLVGFALSSLLRAESQAATEPQEQIQEELRRAIRRVQSEEGRDDPVPVANEVVMTPGMTITATTPDGTIAITAGKGLKRSYTWEGATRSVHMWPRKERWNGSLGIYFPGPGFHWPEHNGIARAVVLEEQLHFETLVDAEKRIAMRKAVAGDYIGPPSHYVYRNDGLVVHWGKTPQRKQMNVDVYQIYVGGKSPTRLAGAEDEKVLVERQKEVREKP